MISAQDRQYGGIGGNSNSNLAAAESEAEMKARLAAEIAQIEAQLQRKRSKRKLKASPSSGRLESSTVAPLQVKPSQQNCSIGNVAWDCTKPSDDNNSSKNTVPNDISGGGMNSFQDTCYEVALPEQKQVVSLDKTKKQQEEQLHLQGQKEETLSAEEAERIRLQEEIKFMEERIKMKKKGRPTPERTISRKASDKEKLADEIRKMEAEIQASRQARPPKAPMRKASLQQTERPTAPGGRASFLMSIKEAAIARDASLREEEDPVVPAETPPPSKREQPPQQPQRQPSSQQQKRPKPPASVAAGGRSSFLDSIKQAAFARDESLRDEEDPIFIQPAAPAQPLHQPVARPKAPMAADSSSGRANFLESVKQAAIARDSSLREEEDPVVIQPTNAASSRAKSPARTMTLPPRSPQKRPKPPMVQDSSGRAGFLDSIKRAAVARDASLREDEDPVVIQSVSPAPVVAEPVRRTKTLPPRSPQKRAKAPMEQDLSGRAGFLESIKHAAVARDASLREEEDPIVLKPVVAEASPQQTKPSIVTDSGGRAALLESIKQAAAIRESSLREEEDPIVLQPVVAEASPQQTKPPIATDSEGRVALFDSIKQAAGTRESSLCCEEDPVELNPTASETPVPPVPCLASISKAATAREERLENGGNQIITSRSDTVPPLPTVNNDRFNLLSAIQQTASGRAKRLEATGGELIMTEVGNIEPATETVRFNLLASVKDAAVAREKRLEETNGELIMKEYEPEVKAQRKSTPQLSFSLAEMVTKKAIEREKRLEEGGEKRMTKIKEKEEYKKDFSSICIEAAALGRLTRLKEYEVDAVAVEKTPEQEWKSNGLLAIQWRCNYMSIIHEAAQMGSETKLPETIVSNCPEEEQDWNADEEEMKLTPRMRQLMELNNRVGTGQHKVDKLVLGRKEQQVDALSLLVRPMYAYSKINDVKLPKPDVPSMNPAKYKKRYKENKKVAKHTYRPMIDIGNEVATRAWERRTRLDRPGAMPKIKEECPCPYCGSASPYQTFAYREIHRKHKEAIQNQKAMQQLEEEIRQLERLTKEKERIEREEREREQERQRLEREEQQKEEERQRQACVSVNGGANVPVPERAIVTVNEGANATVAAGVKPEWVVGGEEAPLARQAANVQVTTAQGAAAQVASTHAAAANQNCACIIL